MNRAKTICIASLVAVSAMTGCQWVDLTPSGEKARVLSAEQVGKCKKVGITTVSVKATMIGISRDEGSVMKELRSLARNAAEGLGGDTVVPASKVANGSQVFDVYNCLRQQPTPPPESGGK